MEKSAVLEPTTEELARHCVGICEDRKALDVRLYDVRDTSLLADFFLICTGRSNPQIRAICEHIRKGIKEEAGIYPKVEGVPASHWVVMDFGPLLVHILHPDTRRYYLLEELWDTGVLVYPEGEEEDLADPVP